MSDEGTSFTIDLPVTGQAGIDAASASIDTLAARLGSASKAAVASSDAISAGERSYRKAEAAADSAAKALERVSLAASAQEGKVRAAVAAVGIFSPEASKAAAKLRLLSAEQAFLADSAAKAKKALDEEAKRLDAMPKPKAKAEEASSGGEEGINFEGLSRGLGKLGGPLAEAGRSVAELGAGFGKLSKSLGAAGPYVAAAVLVVALAAALIAAAVAAVTATAKLAMWAVGLADANRNIELLSAGIARSVKGGAELDDKITSLTRQLPLTREELTSTAQKLADAGLRGKALTDALQTSAIAAAKLKFGPEFGKEMLSLDEQSKVFHENISAIFGGLKVEGLLTALQKLVGLFDADSASGKAMKVVFESIFQPLIDKLAAAEPKIERFFLQLEIWALKALILFKPHASVVLKIGEAFGIVAVLIGGVVVTALGLLAGAIAAPFVLLTALVFAVIEFKDKAIGAFEAVINWLPHFATLGADIIAGLVAGITKGAGAVLAAMKGVVMGAVDGAKKLLGISSPSKVFAEIGMQTGAGMSQGVDRSSGGVKNSLENMIKPPASSGASATVASSASASSSGGPSFGGAVFNFYGVEGAEDAESRFANVLTRIIEGDAAQLGAVSPG